MVPENHKEAVPFSHYTALLRTLDPEDVQRRLRDVPFDGGAYTLTLLGTEYAVAAPEYAITAPRGGAIPPLPAQTFLLRYLLYGCTVPHGGTWKTFREMPWGEVYTKPYSGRVLSRAAYGFGGRLDAFRAACGALGAAALTGADAAYQFDLIGPYRMRLLVWAGDDEFPPSAQVLYSDNFAVGFSAEDRVVAGDLLIAHIKSAMR